MSSSSFADLRTSLPVACATTAPLFLPLFLLPDPLQRFAKLPTALCSCQVTPPKDAADPPNLKTAKDQGDKTQLDVTPVQLLHHTAYLSEPQESDSSKGPSDQVVS